MKKGFIIQRYYDSDTGFQHCAIILKGDVFGFSTGNDGISFCFQTDDDTKEENRPWYAGRVEVQAIDSKLLKLAGKLLDEVKKQCSLFDLQPAGLVDLLEAQGFVEANYHSGVYLSEKEFPKGNKYRAIADGWGLEEIEASSMDEAVEKFTKLMLKGIKQGDEPVARAKWLESHEVKMIAEYRPFCSNKYRTLPL